MCNIISQNSHESNLSLYLSCLVLDVYFLSTGKLRKIKKAQKKLFPMRMLHFYTYLIDRRGLLFTVYMQKNLKSRSFSSLFLFSLATLQFISRPSKFFLLTRIQMHLSPHTLWTPKTMMITFILFATAFALSIFFLTSSRFFSMFITLI